MDRRLFLSSLAAASIAGTARSQDSANFLLDDNRIVLSGARIGATQVHAIIDTAAAISTLSERLAEQLGVVQTGSRRLNTMAGIVQVPLTGVLDFNVPGWTYSPDRWAIMPPNLQPAGLECIVGTTRLRDFKLSFSQSRIEEGSNSGASRLRSRRSPVPLVEWTAGGEKFWALIDTGANLTSVNAQLAGSLVRSPGVGAAFYVTKSGRELRALRLPKMASGEAEFQNVLMRVRGGPKPRVAGVEIGALIGVDFIAERDWSISPSRHVVAASAASSASKQWIGFGVDFRTDAEASGLVVGLLEDGPATRSGLELGDRILRFGGVAVVPGNEARLDAVGSCGCEERLEVLVDRNGGRFSTVLHSDVLL